MNTSDVSGVDRSPSLLKRFFFGEIKKVEAEEAAEEEREPTEDDAVE